SSDRIENQSINDRRSNQMKKFTLIVRCVLASLFVALALALLFSMVRPANAVTNGTADAGRHPYVGVAVFDVLDEDGNQVPAHRCSASLLSPTVVLTAGHCTDGTVAARVWFDEVVQGNPEYPFSGATSYDGIAYPYPVSVSGAAMACPVLQLVM